MGLNGGEQSLPGMVCHATAQANVLSASSLDTSTLLHLSGDDIAMDMETLFPLTLNQSFPNSVANPDPEAAAPPLPWYLSEDSWEVDHMYESDYGPPFCSTVLNSFIKELQGWLASWINTGSCPFIHTHIYKHQFPRCTQDAYTTLSTYQSRTPENKALIVALVEERIKQLLNEQPARTSGAEDDIPFSDLSPFQHLSRVHALTVYQTIGLYDGDIRLRHVAETQIPTLNSWLRQLIRCAQSTASDGPEKFISSLLFPSSQTEPTPSSSHPTTDRDFDNQAVTAPKASSLFSPENIAWYAWLFAETIRRTWTVACTTQTIYLILQVGRAPCPGGVPFTARDGLFSAGSAFAWASRCGGRHRPEWAEMDFVRRGQGEKIFEQRCPDEVDEFAKHLFEMLYGLERVERWRIEKSAKG